MILVDQHAADERIVFSRLKDRYLGKAGSRAAMAPPGRGGVPGRPAGRAGARRAVPGASRESSSSGRKAGSASPAAPPRLPGFDAKGWWEELCEFLRAQEASPKDIFNADRELWRMACHSSIRGGEPVANDRAARLLADLDEAVAAHSCPHGRPVWARIERARLDALFHRKG